METRAHHALIGVFTLGVLMLCFAFIWWFAGRTDFRNQQTYRVQFEGSVSGLNTGSTVLFNGIKVGEVSKLELDLDDPRRVTAWISVAPKTAILSDTKARMEAQGLTGVGVINLIGGKPDAAPIKTSEDGFPPLLIAEASAMQDLMEAARSILARAENVVKTVETVISDNETKLNQVVNDVSNFSTMLSNRSENIGKTIDNIAQFSDILEKNREPFNAIVSNTQQLTARLNESSKKLDGLLAKADSFLGNANDKGVMEEIKATAQSIQRLSDNMDKRVGEISVGLNRFSNQGLRELELLIANGRSTIADIDRVVRDFQRNPSGFLFGSGGGIPEYSRNRR